MLCAVDELHSYLQKKPIHYRDDAPILAYTIAFHALPPPPLPPSPLPCLGPFDIQNHRFDAYMFTLTLLNMLQATEVMEHHRREGFETVRDHSYFFPLLFEYRHGIIRLL